MNEQKELNFGPLVPVSVKQTPEGNLVFRAGARTITTEPEIGSAEAARILGISVRRVQSLCNEGIVLVEGEDWRHSPCVSGNGKYRIKLRKVLALRFAREDK